MRRLAWLIGLISLACVAKPDEPDPVVAPPSVPTAAPAVGRWAPLADRRGVCAWRGATFSPDDFDVIVPSEADQACFNLGECSWVVAGPDDPRISLEDPRASAPLPFKPAEPGPWTRFGGPRFVVEVDDGWLVAWNGGEWGASVSWYSTDGATEVPLSDAHVAGLFDRGDVILAPGRLDPFAPEGAVLHIARDELGRWQARPGPQALRNHAMAGFLDGDTLLVATPTSVEAVDRSGAVSLLAEVNWDVPAPLYPTSIVRSTDGTVFVGLRQVIARLRPTNAGRYIEEWLIPPPCRVSFYAHPICACAGLLPET